ncbi:uncharacterized protein LOC126571178 [Anopheles aquasalis]|uniref:uncharacterized protein LOC126571178 n=1 Tax=Anopheles aquasalis TaxID=42839 RepID=UPI00215B477B|nr:uncharacterized protein LOC126571178 [Anopheles aquasalis]
MQSVAVIALCVTFWTVTNADTPALFTPYQPLHPLDEGYFLQAQQPKGICHVETGLLQQHPFVHFPDEHTYAHYNYHHPVGGAVVPLHVTPYYNQQQQHPQQPHQPFLPPSHYVTFVPGPSSLVAYVPVQRGSQGPWAVPNVFIKGQGYSTNQYVAPSVMKKLLGQDPR